MSKKSCKVAGAVLIAIAVIALALIVYGFFAPNRGYAIFDLTYIAQIALAIISVICLIPGIVFICRYRKA